MGYRYNSELKFVIPHFRELAGEVIEINHEELKRKVQHKLDMAGLNYYMLLPVKEVVNGIEYDADMVVVHCADTFEHVFIKAFENLCQECMKEWGIDFFSYVHNGVLVTVEERSGLF